MSASTHDRETQQRAGHKQAFPMLAAEVIYGGCFVCVDADSLAVDGEDATGLRFVGIAVDGVDNSDGVDSAENVVVFTEGVFLLTSASLTDTDVGRAVYLIDNQTVGLVDHGSVDHDIIVGRIEYVVSATSAWVRINAPELITPLRQFTMEKAGVNATTFAFTTEGARFGGTDLYITAVTAVRSVVTATGAHTAPARRVVTTDWTLAAGVLSAVGDETANTWLITFEGYVLP